MNAIMVLYSVTQEANEEYVKTPKDHIDANAPLDTNSRLTRLYAMVRASFSSIFNLSVPLNYLMNAQLIRAPCTALSGLN